MCRHQSHRQNKIQSMCPDTIVIDAYFLLPCCFPALHQFMFHSEDVNCILTDWRGGSSGLYTDAVNNVRIVGAELEYLVNFLEVKKHPWNVHSPHGKGHVQSGTLRCDQSQEEQGVPSKAGPKGSNPTRMKILVIGFEKPT